MDTNITAERIAVLRSLLGPAAVSDAALKRTAGLSSRDAANELGIPRRAVRRARLLLPSKKKREADAGLVDEPTARNLLGGNLTPKEFRKLVPAEKHAGTTALFDPRTVAIVKVALDDKRVAWLEAAAAHRPGTVEPYEAFRARMSAWEAGEADRRRQRRAWGGIR